MIMSPHHPRGRIHRRYRTTTWWTCAFLVVLSHPLACQGEAPAVRRISLSSTLGYRGVILETGNQTSDAEQVENSDIVLSVRQVISLRGGGGAETFCYKGPSFAAVTDVPGEREGCSWDLGVDLGANSVVASAPRPGRGYLVRDRKRTHVYRLLIIGQSVESQGRWVVTFDVAPLQ